MTNWKNLDTLDSYKALKACKGSVDLTTVMAGESGADRAKNYSVPMAEKLTYNFAAKEVDDTVLEKLAALAKEAELVDKFQELYNGAVINTGENRLVLHQMTRGQLGEPVKADGVDKRTFYVEQQNRIAEFANKVHNGEITNAAGEKFTTVVQIGIGGSDLGPRAMYLALENWAKKNGTFKMDAKFISNVDPDDAAAVLASTDVAHAIFVLVSKSGTTLETLTNESFVKDALAKAGLDASKHMIAVTSETSPLAKSDDYLAAFFMDDYIGGRYSSTSAVGGAVLSLAFGPESSVVSVPFSVEFIVVGAVLLDSAVCSFDGCVFSWFCVAGTGGCDGCVFESVCIPSALLLFSSDVFSVTVSKPMSIMSGLVLPVWFSPDSEYFSPESA